TDASLTGLPEFPRLEYLAVGHLGRDRRITDATLERIGKFTRLTELCVDGAAVTDQGLANLHELARLERLVISRTKVTQDGLAALAPLRSLRQLNFTTREGITDKGAGLLAQLKSLTGTPILKITDQSLEEISTLKQLEVLRVSGPGITDNGLKRISGMKQ